MDKRKKSDHDLSVSEIEKAEKLIIAIFLQALHDACAYRIPRNFSMIKQRTRCKDRATNKETRFISCERRSYNARKFLDKEHPAFSAYCDAMGLEASYVAEKFQEIIHKRDQQL